MEWHILYLLWIKNRLSSPGMMMDHGMGGMMDHGMGMMEGGHQGMMMGHSPDMMMDHGMGMMGGPQATGGWP